MKAAPLLLLLACSTSRHSEQRFDEVEKVDKKADAKEELQIKREDGAWMELDFAPPTPEQAAIGSHGQPVQEPDDGLGEWAEPQAAREGGHTSGLAVPDDPRRRGAAGVVQSSSEFGARHADDLPPHGALIKAVFHGPSTEELVRLAILQETEHATLRAEGDKKDREESAPSAGCSFGFGVWGLVALAGLGAVAWLHFRGLPWRA